VNVASLLTSAVLGAFYFSIKICSYLFFRVNVIEGHILTKELCVANDRLESIILVALRCTIVVHILVVFRNYISIDFVGDGRNL
jgi:hypothetical protein